MMPSRAHGVAERAQRVARLGGSLLVAIRSRWNDVVAAGRLGPDADTVTSRQSGARI